LLKDYASRNSEEAFRTLVDRYAGLVYHAALRQAGNPHTAQEITQAVFIALAQKANRIPSGTILSGWLFRATRFAFSNLVREEFRRQRREQEAVVMQNNFGTNETDSIWERIAPYLNDALDKLSRRDREAILIRFFQDKSHNEVARTLGVSEEAAKKRVARALEKLRLIFARQGLASPVALLAAALSANGAQAAPSGLATSVGSIALAKGSIGSTTTLTAAKGILKLMACTKTKTSIAIGVAAILAAGTTTLVIHHHHRIKASLTADSLRASWAFAGYDTPEDTAQSLFWAMREKNSSSFQVYLDGLVPEMRDKMENDIQSRGDNAFANFSDREMGGVTRYRILKKVMLSDNKAQLQIQFGGLNGPVQMLTMEKNGNEWKCAGE
jgi:RNA polymerase sigma factor (sigma-70 family)